jgi:hypothetical protein
MVNRKSKRRKLMTKKEYRRALESLNLNQTTAADLLRVGLRTTRRHANGEARIDGPTTGLIRLMVEGTVSIEEVRRAIG